MPRPFAVVRAPRATRTPPAKRTRGRSDRTAEWQRSKEYDTGAHGNGEPESVYSPRGIVTLTRRRGRCAGCHGLKELLNDYCDTCRALGLNERQVMNPSLINGKPRNGTSGAKKIPW